jgi:hypothetical protein
MVFGFVVDLYFVMYFYGFCVFVLYSSFLLVFLSESLCFVLFLVVFRVWVCCFLGGCLVWVCFVYVCVMCEGLYRVLVYCV